MVPKIGKKGQELKTKVQKWNSPFNPNSSQQILDWLVAGGFIQEAEKEKTKTDRESLEAILRKEGEREGAEWLEKLVSYKSAGKDIKAWFDDRYIDEKDEVHPRTIPCGASTGRLASSKPNMQNFPKRGFGKDLPRAIVARPGYKFAKADSKQLELRMCLYEAGMDADFGDDAFMWLLSKAADVFQSVNEDSTKPYLADKTPIGDGKYTKGMRNAAKRLSHAANYLEGVTLLSSGDLKKPHTRKMIQRGVLKVFPDWIVDGKTVAFTGVNLARDFFGDASWENRAKALDIQEKYFGRFDGLRRWHREVISPQAEAGIIKSKTGRFLRLRGDALSRLKDAAAFRGQGQSADYVQRTMLELDAVCRLHGDMYLVLNIHDENVLEVPEDMPDDEVRRLFRVMAGEACDALPGFKCPVDVEVGPNYLDCRSLGTVSV